MKLSDFDFNLPEDRIASEPMEPRDHAKLLHIKHDEHTDRHVYDLSDILNAGDVLVYNNSKVIPARLYGHREGLTGKIEILLHKNNQNCIWEAWAKPARKLQKDTVIIFADDFKARVIDKTDDGFVYLDFETSLPIFFEKIEKYGLPPLPPYIKREAKKSDTENYQTIYAEHKGSVAAPTAGLHFTPTLMETLKSKGVIMAPLTLHVGAGTFKPVMVDNIKEHKMHAEFGEITKETATIINNAKQNDRRIIAVGTTSMRLLESAADSDGTLHPFCDETDIFITPGFEFKIVDYLMTNFHLPKSTLFMLVSAFMSRENMLNAYNYAIKNQYRFFSYGDACFLERTQN